MIRWKACFKFTDPYTKREQSSLVPVQYHQARNEKDAIAFARKEVERHYPKTELTLSWIDEQHVKFCWIDGVSIMAGHGVVTVEFKRYDHRGEYPDWKWRKYETKKEWLLKRLGNIIEQKPHPTHLYLTPDFASIEFEIEEDY